MPSIILFYLLMLLTTVHGYARVDTISTIEIAKFLLQNVQRQEIEHTTPTLIAKEVAAVAVVANPAASSSSSIQVPKYNNFALSCESTSASLPFQSLC